MIYFLLKCFSNAIYNCIVFWISFLWELCVLKRSLASFLYFVKVKWFYFTTLHDVFGDFFFFLLLFCLGLDIICTSTCGSYLVQIEILLYCYVSASSCNLFRFLSLRWITSVHKIHLHTKELLPSASIESTPFWNSSSKVVGLQVHVTTPKM